jgi:hypothetical protein
MTADRSFRHREFDGIEYWPGRRFVVAQTGAYLSGMVPVLRHAWETRSRSLAVGEEIECAGYGPGWGGDPGYGVHWCDSEMQFAEFHPQHGGMFAFRPTPGWVRPAAYTPEEAQAQ